MASNATLAKIHIAKKQLGLDDETYRAMLLQHGGVNSSKDLTAEGAARVLAHLERSGFKPAPGKHGKRPKSKPGCSALMDKVEALLADAKRPWAYANGMAKRMFRVDQVGWLDAVQLGKLVAALQIDADRRRDSAAGV